MRSRARSIQSGSSTRIRCTSRPSAANKASTPVDIQCVPSPFRDKAVVAVATEVDGITSCRYLFSTPGKVGNGSWYVSPTIFASMGKPFDILNLAPLSTASLRLTFQRGALPLYETTDEVQIVAFSENCGGGPSLLRGKNTLVDARTGKKLEFGVVH
jgi:hypothetical protein